LNQNRKLLLALDLEPESEPLVQRVRDLYFDELENLHVVHVIREGFYDHGVSVEASCLDPHIRRQRDHAEMRLRQLLCRYGLTVNCEQMHCIHGEPAFEIKRLASLLSADLVIVGSHCKQGDWMQLPGATTNCVIQGIGSDVMAVKL